MAQVIIMAKHYNRRPSEIMNIDNDYVAYCFDEVALFLEAEAMNDKGELNWNRIRWKDERNRNNNQELMDFMKKYS